MNSLYGTFRQQTFADIFPDASSFEDEFNNNSLFGSNSYDSNFISRTQNTTGYDNSTGSRFNANLIYFILYSNYGNSVVASSDTNRFKYRLWSIIYQYGPTWAKEMVIQEKLRALTEDEIISGSNTVANSAMNPSIDPNETNGVLSYINQQNTSKFYRSKIDGYQNLLATLTRDPTQAFIDKFKDLFLKVIMPEYPLLYNDIEEE